MPTYWQYPPACPTLPLQKLGAIHIDMD